MKVKKLKVFNIEKQKNGNMKLKRHKGKFVKNKGASLEANSAG